jgi:RNA polymerase-binding transcription factor DksA
MKALTNCETMLVLPSKDSVESVYVNNEILFAHQESKKIIPLLIGACKRPLSIFHLQYVDFTHDYESAFKLLLIDLIGKSGTKTEVPVIESKSFPITGLRYSDEDLRSFAEVIKKKLDTANREREYLEQLLKIKMVNKPAGEFPDITDQINKQKEFIDHLKKAEERIKDKTYGICRMSGKLIERERLAKVPHATISQEVLTNNKRDK